MDEQDIARVRDWCTARVPAAVRDRLRLECEVGDRELTIVERRPPLPVTGGTVWTREPVARLRCARYVWTLYWCDRNERFRRYVDLEPTTDVGVLLDEIDRDPHNLFLG
jgi:hypothetical protein